MMHRSYLSHKLLRLRQHLIRWLAGKDLSIVANVIIPGQFFVSGQGFLCLNNSLGAPILLDLDELEELKALPLEERALEFAELGPRMQQAIRTNIGVTVSDGHGGTAFVPYLPRPRHNRR